MLAHIYIYIYIFKALRTTPIKTKRLLATIVPQQGLIKPLFLLGGSFDGVSWEGHDMYIQACLQM